MDRARYITCVENTNRHNRNEHGGLARAAESMHSKQTAATERDGECGASRSPP